MMQGGQADFIDIDGVSKTYTTQDGNPTVAAEDINLKIAMGEFISILGPSGCGKSTLLTMVSGLMQPSSGQIRIEGQPVIKPYTNAGVVFQRDLLFDWRTVLDNVLLQFEMRGQDPRPHEERARQLLHSVGLQGFEKKHPWELSGGMRQRVAICRALVHDPPLLLMDEPFGALDALTRDQLQIDLQRLWQESRKTVLFVTHSIDEAVFLSDRVLVMTPRPGRIQQSLTIELPRPRRLNVRESAEFTHYVHEIRRCFQETGVIRE